MFLAFKKSTVSAEADFIYYAKQVIVFKNSDLTKASNIITG
jgi:hypothetical protein